MEVFYIPSSPVFKGKAPVIRQLFNLLWSLRDCTKFSQFCALLVFKMAHGHIARVTIGDNVVLYLDTSGLSPDCHYYLQCTDPGRSPTDLPTRMVPLVRLGRSPPSQETLARAQLAGEALLDPFGGLGGGLPAPPVSAAGDNFWAQVPGTPASGNSTPASVSSPAGEAPRFSLGRHVATQASSGGSSRAEEGSPPSKRPRMSGPPSTGPPGRSRGKDLSLVGSGRRPSDSPGGTPSSASQPRGPASTNSSPQSGPSDQGVGSPIQPPAASPNPPVLLSPAPPRSSPGRQGSPARASTPEAGTSDPILQTVRGFGVQLGDRTYLVDAPRPVRWTVPVSALGPVRMRLLASRPAASHSRAPPGIPVGQISSADYEALLRWLRSFPVFSSPQSVRNFLVDAVLMAGRALFHQ